MISNKLSSKKVISGIVFLIIIAIGTVLYFSSSRKSPETIPQTENNQPAVINPISDQSAKMDNSSQTQQEPASQSSVKNVSPTLKPAQEELDKIDISEWKTYTNTDYEYEIKYPADWTIITRGDYQVHFLAPKTPKFDPSAPGWGDVSITMQNSGLSDVPDQYFAKTPITLGKDSGNLYTGVNCGQDSQNPDISCTIVDIAKDSKEVNIEHFNELKKKDGAKYIGVYYKMLDTFKFFE